LLSFACVLTPTLAASPADSGLKPGDSFRDCPDCPLLVVVPSGEFDMGAEQTSLMRDGSLRPHGPVRRIRIERPFAVARFELSEAEFADFVADTGHRMGFDCGLSAHEEAERASRQDDGQSAPHAALPVVCVSWRDADAYVAWLAVKTGAPYRLLSEAEWEYAARAGSINPWPWGATTQGICLHANVLDASAMAILQDHPVGQVPDAAVTCDDRAAARAPVGQYRANAFGVHDMVGNVWEWVADCSVLPYADQPTDGSAMTLGAEECTHRAIRGGSWRSRLERQLITFRGRDPEQTRSDIFGFRVARSLLD
jgi:formylglycine-generating enzyme required for sulfatase activity